MDRREYLKRLAVGSLGTGLLLQACEPNGQEVPPAVTPSIDRTPEELARDQKLMSERFFTDEEMKTVTRLCDIIIPKDEVSGSASEAGVPGFIEFIAKDMPEKQVPLRGGLRWLDLQCVRRYQKPFIACSESQQMEMVDLIAWPEKADSAMLAGVSFFNLMRDLTASGFYTSEIGIKDLGYVGNRPNQWDGVPQDVLDQYGLRYDQRTLDESVKFDA